MQNLLFNGLMAGAVSLSVIASRDVMLESISSHVKLASIGQALLVVPCTLAASFLNGAVVSNFAVEVVAKPLVSGGLGLFAIVAEVVFVVGFAGVFEELAFRGLILTHLAGHMPTRQAVVVTAAAFATLHLVPAWMPFLFVMGLLLGWLRVSTGSVIPPMVAHMLHNTVVWTLEGVS